jgi:hypothetical protein
MAKKTRKDVRTGGAPYGAQVGKLFTVLKVGPYICNLV